MLRVCDCTVTSRVLYLQVLVQALSCLPLLLNVCDCTMTSRVLCLQVLVQALSCLPLLLNSVDELGSPRCNKAQLMTMARQVSAALAALGGFEEVIKPGCVVQVRLRSGATSPPTTPSIACIRTRVACAC